MAKVSVMLIKDNYNLAGVVDTKSCFREIEKLPTDFDKMI